jgi:hypothetical protein
MAIISGRGGAPGSYVYEGAIASTSGTASFNTVYMLVDAPDESSVTVFPYNRPVAIGSLNEYENLIGTLPTTGGPELQSYYAVKAFFQQATVADLRVTRVGTPSVIQELSFNPGANKDDGVTAPSALQKDDKVYVKVLINGVELGDRSTSGAWLGVPVIIPVNYIPGDVDNNLNISNAMRDAVVAAIQADADISAGAYIRETGSGDPACDECAYLYLTGRVYNSQVEIIDSTVITGNQYVFAASAYTIQNITESDQSVYDWIQCVRTAFDDPSLSQGYMCAPAAFTIYGMSDRVNLGQSMEEVCSDANHKWLAMIDCGPYYVTSVETYKDFIEHDPADGFENGDLELIENVIYRWTDTNSLKFTPAAYDPDSAAASANPALVDGERRALKDDRFRRVESGVNTSTNVITLTEAWPEDIKSGELVQVSAFINDPAVTAPTYSDVYTSVISEDLIGGFYAIAADVDISLSPKEIKLATSRTRALANEPIDVVTAGTPQGGGLLDIRYTSPAWRFDVTIKGKTSDLIEVNNNEGSAFNTKHFPGTLQKPTAEYDFRLNVRQLTNPSKSIIRGGSTLNYFASSAVTIADGSIVVADHGYSTGDLVYVTELPSGTAPSGITSGLGVYAIKVDANTIQLASSQADAFAGTAISLGDTGTNSSTVFDPRGGPAQSVVTSGGDAMFFSADHGLSTAEKIYFDNDITNPSLTLVEGTTKSKATLYYVHKEDRNFFRLTPSASNLAAEVFIDLPTVPVNTASPVRFYQAVTVAPDGGTFSDVGIVRMTRGRKYQLDATLAVFNVKDEAGVGIQGAGTNPYGGTYQSDISTDFRLSASQAPVGVNEYKIASSEVVPVGGVISQTDHGYLTGQVVKLDEATGATLPSGWIDDAAYFVIKLSADTFALAATAADAVAGTQIDPADSGSDNPEGGCFLVSLDSNPYTYTYTEDEDSRPLSPVRDFAGENNFYCVPLSEGDQANAALTEVYGHGCLEIGNERITLYSSYTEIEFVEPQVEVPNGLWNFDAVTSADLIGEALRGVNNNGVPQAVVVEKGMDNHSRLFEESQNYSTTQGFLAYYAPHVLNDVGVYVPPTSFVTGLAMKRYRDDIAGFRLPPAGAKYALAGARGLQVEITTGMQNVSNPYGLNALRQLPGYSNTDPDTGITYGPVFVWGARTRINPANAEQALYKFVNTRVIMNVIYGTLRNALDGQIFNIIDGRAVTFNQIRTLVSNVLYSNFYVPGALFGASAAEAFDVVVDDRNNPPANLENGLVNVQTFVVPVPTLERIEIDLLRVSIGGIADAKANLGLNG